MQYSEDKWTRKRRQYPHWPRDGTFATARSALAALVATPCGRVLLPRHPEERGSVACGPGGPPKMGSQFQWKQQLLVISSLTFHLKQAVSRRSSTHLQEHDQLVPMKIGDSVILSESQVYWVCWTWLPESAGPQPSFVLGWFGWAVTCGATWKAGCRSRFDSSQDMSK